MRPPAPLLLLAPLALLLGPRPAAACSCVEISPREALEAHAAVFEGRVLEVRRPEDPAGATRVVLEVVQRWEGADAERVELETPREPSLCGVGFEPETSWLVYADVGAGGLLSTDLCQRTRRIEEAAEDLAVLGAGVTPVDITERDEVESPRPPASSVRRAGCASCAVASRGAPPRALPALLLALVLGRRALRRRIRHTQAR